MTLRIDLTSQVEQLVVEAEREFGPGEFFEIRLPLPTGWPTYGPSLVAVATPAERSSQSTPYFDLSSGSLILKRGRTPT